jgi:hypothetical protein
LNEECIPLTDTKQTSSIIDRSSTDSTSDGFERSEGQDEPSTLKLIRYKQHIHFENERRRHREQLAEKAQQIHNQEQSLIMKNSSIDINTTVRQTDRNENVQSLSHDVSDVTRATHSDKSTMKRNENDIVNEEIIFESDQYRRKDRKKNKLLRSFSITYDVHGGNRMNSDISMTASQNQFMPTIQFIVCKSCGNMIDTHGIASMNNQDANAC